MRYQIQDPDSGAVLNIEGDSPPTEQDLTEIFAEHRRRNPGVGDILRSPAPQFQIPPATTEESRSAQAMQDTGTPIPEDVGGPLRMAKEALLDAPLQAIGTVSKKVVNAPFEIAEWQSGEKTPRIEPTLPQFNLTPAEERWLRASPNALSRMTPALAGVNDLAMKVAEGFIQPEQALLLPALGGEGAIAKLGTILFGGSQAAEVPEQVKNAIAVVSDPDASTGQKIGAVGAPGVSAILAGLMLKHGLISREAHDALLAKPEPGKTISPEAQAWAASFGAGTPAETRMVSPQARVRPTQPYVAPEPGPLQPVLTPRQQELVPQIEKLQKLILTEKDDVLANGLMRNLTALRLEYEHEGQKGLDATGQERQQEYQGTAPETELSPQPTQVRQEESQPDSGGGGNQRQQVQAQTQTVPNGTVATSSPPVASETPGAAPTGELPVGAQPPLSGALSEIYRAGDPDERGVKAFSSWSEQKTTAEAYLDNPGFGGKSLRTEQYPLGNVLDADTTNRRGMADLAEMLGFPREAGDEWFDNGWRYPWEESAKVKSALKKSGYDAIRYIDDFPDGAKTVLPIKDKLERAQPPPSGDQVAEPRTMVKPADAPVEPPAKTIAQPVGPLLDVPAVKGADSPTQATAKFEQQVTKVATTEGQRPAKEIKSELVSKLEGFLAAAPAEADLKIGHTTKLKLWPKGTPETVEVNIPGDGQSKVRNTKEAIGEVLDRAKKISTTSGTRATTPRVPYDSDAEPDKLVSAYGSAEAAYQSVVRQRDALQAQDPPTDTDGRNEWNRQIQNAEYLVKELYGKTKASVLESKAEHARQTAKVYREGAAGFEKSIAKLEAIKRKSKAHNDQIADLKSRYAENQRRIAEYEKDADKWEREAAKEKGALDAGTKPEAPAPTPSGSAPKAGSTGELSGVSEAEVKPALPADQSAALEAARKAAKFAGDAADGTRVDNFIKRNGRWYRVGDDGAVGKIPTNAKQHAQLEEKATLPPAPPETRPAAQILSQSARVRIKLPEGATVVRVTDERGRKAEAFIAAANRGENSFRGVDIRKVEAGFKDKNGNFKVVPGDVEVSEVRGMKSLSAGGAGMDPTALESHVRQQYGAETQGKIRIINDPSQDYGGRAVADNGRLTFIELNAAKLGSLEKADRVLEHELSHGAVLELGDSLNQFLTGDERLGVLSDISRAGYSVDNWYNELQTRSVHTLADSWKGRNWFEKAVGSVMQWATRLGIPLTRIAAERVAAQAIARTLKGLKEGGRVPSGQAETVFKSLARTEEEYERKRFFAEPALAEATAGALGDLARMKTEQADQLGLSPRARAFLNLPRESALYARATAIGSADSIYGYMEAREWARDRTPNERWHVLQDALQSYGNDERRFLDNRKKYEAAREEVQSPSFRKKVERLAQYDAAKQITEESENTFRNMLAVKAADYLAQLNRANLSDARIEQLRSDIEVMRQLRDYATAVGMKMEQVVATVFPNYFETGAASRTAAGFTELYTSLRRQAGNPVVGDELQLVQHASEVLAANRSLREQLMWRQWMKAEPDNAEAVAAFGKAFAARLEADPTAAIKELVAKEGKLATRAAKAKAAWVALDRDVMRTVENYSDREGAFMADTRMRSGAEWRNLVNVVNQDVGALAIPETMREAVQRGEYNEFTGNFARKDPYGDVHTFELGSTKAEAARAQEKIEAYLAKVDSWMYDPANENHPDQPFWQRERDLVDAVYNSQGVLNPGAVRSAMFHKSWGMPEFLFKQVKLPAAKVAQTAIENWHRANAVSTQWVQGTMASLIRHASEAAMSHGIDPNLGMKEWRDSVLNPLAWAYRHNIALKAGDRLYGIVLTAKDIDALRYMGRAENELHRKQKNLGAENVMPQQLTYDEWARGAFAIRTTHEFGAEPGTTVSRGYSQRGEVLAKRMAKLAGDDFQGISDLLYERNNWPFVQRWLTERNADYSHPSPFDLLFTKMAEKIRDGSPDAPLSVEEMVEFIRSNSDDTHDEAAIHQMTTGMMHRELSGIYTRVFKPAGEAKVSVISPSRDSSFTKAFERDVSNSFMYDYGLVNRGEIISEGIDSTQFYMQRLVRSFQSVEKIYGDTLQELGGLSTEKEKRDYIRKHGSVFQTGDDFKDFEDMRRHHQELRYFLDNLDLFGGKNAASFEGLTTLFRITGDLVKATIAGIGTAGRIVIDSGIKQSMVLAAFDRFNVMSRPKAMVSMAMSSFNMMVKGPAIVAARRLHLIRQAEKTYSGLAEEIMRNGKFFDQQFDYGLGTKMPTWDNMVNNWRMPYTHGGGYTVGFANNPAVRVLQQGGLRAVALLEIGMEPITSIFPSLLYATAYDSVARQISWGLKHTEARARRTFDTYERTGQLSRFDLDKPKSLRNVLTPREVIGNGFLPATITELSRQREFWKRGTDVDLNDQIITFWRRLRDTPPDQRENVHLLSADVDDPAMAAKKARARLGAIASIGLFDIHHASPINRMWGMRRSPMARAGFPLAGWPVQSTRQIFDLFGKSAGDPEITPRLLTALSVIMGLSAVGMAVGTGDLSRRALAKLKWLAFKKIDPLKVIGEGRDTRENAQIAAAETIGYISGLSHLTDQVFGEKSNRSASMETLFMVDKIDSLIKYISGVAHTGDITYGFAKLVNKDATFFQWATSRMPGQQGLVAAGNVRTLLHKFAPQEMVRQGGGGMPVPTEMSPIKEELENAIYKGDMQGAADAYERLRAKAAELGRPDPDKLAQGVMRSLNPYSMALTGHPSEEQRQAILDRMPAAERQLLLDAETQYVAAGQNVGVNSEMVRREPGSRGTAKTASSGGSVSFSGGSIPSLGGSGAVSGGLGRISSGPGRLSTGLGRIGGGGGVTSPARRLSRLVTGRLRTSRPRISSTRTRVKGSKTRRLAVRGVKTRKPRRIRV